MHVAIEKIALPTQTRLRSTQILTSLPQIVSELVQNSLDAGARSVTIGIDCEEWTCWVKDDGCGIGKEGLELIAREGDGGRYATSKTYTDNSINAVSTFGFRGEALASAAEVSCLEISSRTIKSQTSWSVVIKGGKRLYAGPSVRWRRETTGTVACIRDAFYNLPIRRLSHPSVTRTWESVRQEMETYALVFPHVAFSLEDAPERMDPTLSRRERVVRIPKTPSPLACFRHIYGRALVDHVEDIDVTFGSMKILGFISLNGSHSKVLIVYVNHHPISRCDLHRVIEVDFSRSSFSKAAFDEDGVKDLPTSTTRTRRSPRKVEKRPVYVLDIEIPSQFVDNCLDPGKSSVQLENHSTVLRDLSSTVRSFLSKHGFSPERQERHSSAKHLSNHGSVSPSPKKRRKIASFLDDRGYADVDSVSNISGLSLQDKSGQINHLQSPIAELAISVHDESQPINWTDRNTGQVFIIDSRTGNTYNRLEGPPHGVIENIKLPHVHIERGRRTPQRLFPPSSVASCSTEYPQLAKGSPPCWLKQALETNQVYSQTESRVHSLDASCKPNFSRYGLDRTLAEEYTFPSSDQKLASQGFRTCHPDASIRQLTKSDLQHGQIIGQVDRKFIACLLTPLDNEEMKKASSLVLFDQHAVDERIRVERFLKPLCMGFLHSRSQGADSETGVATSQLKPPRPILLTQQEASMLMQNREIREAFRKWGFLFSEVTKQGSSGTTGDSESGCFNGYVQVLVSSLPGIVCDKLLQGDELRDLIKGFIGQIQSGEVSLDQHGAGDISGDHDFGWLVALRYCPRGLRNLINSKACRGAVMFNDYLGVDQCQRLVEQLSQTAFPFQCAHGRPSLVPLFDNGDKGGIMNRRQRLHCDWEKFEAMGSGFIIPTSSV